jgi:hypothetical protein
MGLKHWLISLIAPEYADAPERINMLRRHLEGIADPILDGMYLTMAAHDPAEAHKSKAEYQRELAEQALYMDSHLYDGGTRKYRDRLYGSLNSW